MSEFSGSNLGAIIASFTALIIAVFGRWFRSFIYESNLKVIKICGFPQKQELTVWRLIIRNFGNEVSENAQADVVKIFDGGKRRAGFLPMPLQWMHLDIESRNILPKQTVYLDIFDEISRTHGSPASSEKEIRLRSSKGLDIPNFTRLKEGETIIEIVIFQKSGTNITIKLLVEFNRAEPLKACLI